MAYRPSAPIRNAERGYGVLITSPATTSAPTGSASNGPGASEKKSPFTPAIGYRVSRVAASACPLSGAARRPRSEANVAPGRM